jgi:hypothetical protein
VELEEQEEVEVEAQLNNPHVKRIYWTCPNTKTDKYEFDSLAAEKVSLS